MASLHESLFPIHFWSGCYGDEGVCAAVIKEPFPVEENQTFAEGGSGGVLAAAFVGLFGMEDGLVEAF